MKMWISRRRIAVFAVMLALILTSIATARQSNINTGASRRVDTMTTAKTALTVLGNMARGRMVFDHVQALAARHDLIVALRAIPRQFRKPHSDTAKRVPETRARPEIWIRWDAFSTKATSAKRAARALRVSSLSALQSTLPRLLKTCLDCHRTFRVPEG